METLIGATWTHIIAAISGATSVGILGHALDTFPQPTNKYAIWMLGVIRFAIGQRARAAETFNGTEGTGNGK